MSQAAGFIVFLDRPPRVGFQSDGAIRVVEVPDSFEAADAAASDVERILRESGYQDEGVVLALPSPSCLAVSLADAELDFPDYQALAYAVEPLLPLAAEDLAVARVDGGRLCIAAKTEGLFPVIEALEARGIVVQSVCPSALLALQTFTSQEKEEGSFLLAWQCENKLECFWMDGGKLKNWWHLPADEIALARAIGVFSLTQHEAVRIKMVQLSDKLLEGLRHVPDVELIGESDLSLWEAAVAASAAVTSGNASPPADLRTGPLSPKERYRLIRGPLRAALAGAALLLACSCAAMLIRSHRYRAEAERFHHEQEVAFRAALPGQSIPSGVLSRLRSEKAKLTVSTGDVPNSPRMPASALDALRRLLAALPADVKYRFSEVRLDGKQLSLDGETLSHGDADRIAGCLRMEGFNIEPPRSQQRADQSIGVHWTGVSVAANEQAGSKRR